MTTSVEFTFDDSVVRALAKWPNVPHCTGWLRLDRRGQWRLDGQPVMHPGINEFFARNYAVDDAGRWFVQNGPQRAYVDLDAAPWVLRTSAPGEIQTHTGRAAGLPLEVVVTPEGDLYLVTFLGLGLVDDRDLVRVAGWIRVPGEAPTPDADPLERLLPGAGPQPAPAVVWGTRQVALRVVDDGALEATFGFVRRPTFTPGAP